MLHSETHFPASSFHSFLWFDSTKAFKVDSAGFSESEVGVLRSTWRRAASIDAWKSLCSSRTMSLCVKGGCGLTRESLEIQGAEILVWYFLMRSGSPSKVGRGLNMVAEEPSGVYVSQFPASHRPASDVYAVMLLKNLIEDLR